MFHTVRGAHPDYVATDVLGDVMTRRAVGPAVQGAGRDQEGVRRAGVGWRASRSGHAHLLRADSRRRGDRAGARGDARDVRQRRQGADHRSRSRAHPRARRQRTSTRPSPIRRSSASRSRSRSRSATGDCSSSSATSIGPSSRPTCSGSRSTISSARISRSASSCPRRSPIARRCRRRSTSRRWSRITRVTPPRRPARRSIPRPANLDARTQRFTLANGMKVALLPKKTRGEAVSFNVALHFGDEKSVFGKASTGALDGQHAHARHDQAVAAGDRGCVRQAARQGRRRRARRRAPTPPARPYRAQLPDVLQAHRGSAARAVVPGDRARPAQARARHAARSVAHRSAGDRVARDRAAMPIRTRPATRATPRRSRKASPATTP